MEEKEFDTSIFWNINQTLTYNKFINFILGNRGGGKTFGYKKWCIDNFIKKKEQFGYVRRYKEDLKEPMEQFFKDIYMYYPDYEFKTQGNKFYIRLRPSDAKEKWSEEDVAGYGFILSTANNKKSIAYPNITTIGFDEFLLEKGLQHYLNEEPLKLLNLIETIARPGTNHKRVRVFLLANAISITNPYFLFFDLKMPNRKDKNNKYVWLHPSKPILVEDVRNEAFIDRKRNTEFGKLIEGTKYSEYSIENKFLLDDNTFIEKRSSKSRFYFTFTYKENKFGVWLNIDDGLMWVSKDYDPSFPINYSLTLKDHSPNTMLLNTKGRKGYFKNFIDAYKNGCVRFESMNIKNLCYEVIKMIMN